LLAGTDSRARCPMSSSSAGCDSGSAAMRARLFPFSVQGSRRV
jgi:hypothetical protein